MHSWIVLALFFVAAATAQSSNRTEVPVPEEVAEVLKLLEQEVEEPELESSGTDEDDELSVCFDSRESLAYVRWVTYDRATGVDTVAGDYSVQEVLREIPRINKPVCTNEPHENYEMIDPVYEFIRYNMDDVASEMENRERYLSSLNTSTYPGNAIGLLTNEECTAFLVGPHHAITTADCVYDVTEREWRGDNMDLWLARDCNTVAAKLLWSSVKIPYQYYANRNLQHNWAFIEFEATTKSKTWLTMAYDPTMHYRIGPVKVGGYSSTKPLGCPYMMQCLTQKVESESCQLNLKCNVQISLPGAPVVAADFIAKRTHAPPAYGVVVQYWTTMWFTKPMFWSVCKWMEESGHNPGCQESRYFVNVPYIEDLGK